MLDRRLCPLLLAAATLVVACSDEESVDNAIDGGAADAASDASSVDAGADAAPDVAAPDAGEVDATELVGLWVDEFGTRHEITPTLWTQTFSAGAATFAISAWSDAERWVVAQNGAENEFSATLWSRFDYAENPDGDWLYCQTMYDGVDEQAALDAEPADAADPTSGCSGFAWTTLTPDDGM